MAKPLIATDVPGCRQIVEQGVNGFLVPPRDAPALASAMLELAQMPRERVDQIGAASRRRAEIEFDEKIVIDHYIAAIRAVARSA